ncbi:PREDICTED: uncharacterized protein LOC109186074 [Ipomoea nil]|uniref:uncharacterized protein LOC109186074 n=1 Tax=Ipomoea nil TaxID=35883 RepID=UPI00090180F9|nr:PREDICTED: uncharacterized protein LOC109186074 [Ipomoea nil]
MGTQFSTYTSFKLGCLAFTLYPKVSHGASSLMFQTACLLLLSLHLTSVSGQDYTNLNHEISFPHLGSIPRLFRFLYSLSFRLPGFPISWCFIPQCEVQTQNSTINGFELGYKNPLHHPIQHMWNHLPYKDPPHGSPNLHLKALIRNCRMPSFPSNL